MAGDCFARLTLPGWALGRPDVDRVVRGPDSRVERREALNDDTTILEGRPSGGEFEEIETVLRHSGIACDRFCEDTGDGSVDTCIREVFRPAGEQPGHEATMPVTRCDVPVLSLDVWDPLAGAPGGAVAWATVQRHLGLPADSVADWVAQHPLS